MPVVRTMLWKKSVQISNEPSCWRNIVNGHHYTKATPPSRQHHRNTTTTASPHFVQLVKNLRGKIRVLETNLTITTEELNKLKLDGKYLRVRELETEVKAYYSEVWRSTADLGLIACALNPLGLPHPSPLLVRGTIATQTPDRVKHPLIPLHFRESPSPSRPSPVVTSFALLPAAPSSPWPRWKST